MDVLRSGLRTFIPFVSDQEIIAIGCGVLDRSLPKAAWTHAAHFAAAAWLLECRRDLNAALAMPGIIRAYNESTGVANTDTGGYHETITQASLRATRAFLTLHDNLALFAAVNELLSSPLGQPEWLLEYWSRERLFSVEARRNWMEPDLAPLPF
jgi:hypothetical protein